jgi:hypothetical protein
MLRFSRSITLEGIREILDHGAEDDRAELLQSVRLYPELVLAIASIIASTVSNSRRTPHPTRRLIAPAPVLPFARHS